MTSVPNRGGGFVQERAEVVRGWLAERASSGGRVDEDAVWERITSLWPAIGTEAAERILGAAMAGS